jgi:hypothetical protein
LKDVCYVPVRPPAPVTSTVAGDPPAAAETASAGPRLDETTRWRGGRRVCPLNGDDKRIAAAAVAMVAMFPLRRLSDVSGY